MKVYSAFLAILVTVLSAQAKDSHGNDATLFESASSSSGDQFRHDSASIAARDLQEIDLPFEYVADETDEEEGPGRGLRHIVRHKKKKRCKKGCDYYRSRRKCEKNGCDWDKWDHTCTRQSSREHAYHAHYHGCDDYHSRRKCEKNDCDWDKWDHTCTDH